jgi:hypothetical protein
MVLAKAPIRVTSDPTGRCVPGRDNQADRSLERQPASHTQSQTRHPSEDQVQNKSHTPPRKLTHVAVAVELDRAVANPEPNKPATNLEMALTWTSVARSDGFEPPTF